VDRRGKKDPGSLARTTRCAAPLRYPLTAGSSLAAKCLLPQLLMTCEIVEGVVLLVVRFAPYADGRNLMRRRPRSGTGRRDRPSRDRMQTNVLSPRTIGFPRANATAAARIQRQTQTVSMWQPSRSTRYPRPAGLRTGSIRLVSRRSAGHTATGQSRGGARPDKNQRHDFAVTGAATCRPTNIPRSSPCTGSDATDDTPTLARFSGRLSSPAVIPGDTKRTRW